jgi:hypothetical protein
MTVKALLQSPRYTGHDATESVLRNISNLLTNCVFNLLAQEFGIYILAHPVCKMRIIQEPEKVA